MDNRSNMQQTSSANQVPQAPAHAQWLPSAGRRDPYLESLEVWNRLVSLVRYVNVPKGTKFIQAGALGKCLYLVERGTAVVKLNGRVLAVVGSGGFLGEISLLVMGRHVADVVADTDLVLLQACFAPPFLLF